MLHDFNREMELIEEIDKEADEIAKRKMDTLDLFFELQKSLGEIQPMAKSPWEIKEEKRKQQEKEILEQMAKNSPFENYHLRKDLRNGIDRRHIQRSNKHY